MRRILDYEFGDSLLDLEGCVATVGVFDGVHVGHQAILDRTTTWARTEGRPSVLITFSVHPDLVVHGRAPSLILSLDHRLREVEKFGLDAALVLQFDDDLRETPAERFVEEILVNSLGVRGVVLGHDTAVGKDRRGDAELLDTLGLHHGFEVKVVGEISVDGEVISSTRIRAALAAGELDEAARLLGRQPSVFGRVVQGEGRGRQLGFPTANLDIDAECRPSRGVYAVLAIIAGESHDALCNIGHRPTFTDSGQSTVEVHLLDFEGDLYDQEMEVVFLSRLRDERSFDGAEQLVAQIEEDRRQSMRVFGRVHRPSAGA